VIDLVEDQQDVYNGLVPLYTGSPAGNGQEEIQEESLGLVLHGPRGRTVYNTVTF